MKKAGILAFLFHSIGVTCLDKPKRINMTFLILIIVACLIAYFSMKNRNNSSEKIDEAAFALERRIIEHNRAAQLKHVDIAGNPNEKESQIIEIAGVHIDDRKLACMKCMKGEELMLVPDDENKFDKNAIEIKSFRGHMLGFIPAYLAAEVAPRIAEGIVYRAFYSHHSFEGKRALFYAYVYLKEYQP